jgi:hypothetical protein
MLLGNGRGIEGYWIAGKGAAGLRQVAAAGRQMC